MKPNAREFADLAGHDLPGRTALVQAVRQRDTGHGWSCRWCARRRDCGGPGRRLARARPPHAVIQSAVGSGDSMLAGMTWGLVRGLTFPEAVRTVWPPAPPTR